MRLTTVFPLLALLLSGPSAAAMYKWTDAEGHVQYGAHPPAGVNAKPIKAAPAPSSQPSRAPLQEQLDELEKQAEQRREEASKAAETQQEAENRKINCQNARKNIGELNRGGHRLMHMPDGSYRRFTEEERQAEIAKNKKAIDEFCK